MNNVNDIKPENLVETINKEQYTKMQLVKKLLEMGFKAEPAETGYFKHPTVLISTEYDGKEAKIDIFKVDGKWEVERYNAKHSLNDLVKRYRRYEEKSKCKDKLITDGGENKAVAKYKQQKSDELYEFIRTKEKELEQLKAKWRKMI